MFEIAIGLVGGWFCHKYKDTITKTVKNLVNK